MSNKMINMAAVIASMLYGYGPGGERVPFAVRSNLVMQAHPERHNTLRYDQVERLRKTRRKANRLKFKRYRRAA